MHTFMIPYTNDTIYHNFAFARRTSSGLFPGRMQPQEILESYRREWQLSPLVYAAFVAFMHRKRVSEHAWRQRASSTSADDLVAEAHYWANAWKDHPETRVCSLRRMQCSVTPVSTQPLLRRTVELLLSRVKNPCPVRTVDAPLPCGIRWSGEWPPGPSESASDTLVCHWCRMKLAVQRTIALQYLIRVMAQAFPEDARHLSETTVATACCVVLGAPRKLWADGAVNDWVWASLAPITH